MTDTSLTACAPGAGADGHVHHMGLGDWAEFTTPLSGTWLHGVYLWLRVAKNLVARNPTEAEKLIEEVIAAAGREIALLRIDDPYCPSAFYTYLSDEEKEHYKDRWLSSST